MKKLNPTSRLALAAVGLMSCLAANHAGAALQYWDPNGTTSIGGDGVWDTTSSLWVPNSGQLQVDSSLLVPFTNGNAAVFNAGPSAGGNSGTFTITVNNPITIGGIFNGSLNPAPCVLTINAGPGGQLVLAAGTDAFSNFGTAPAGTTTINCPISGTGTLNPQSSGRLVLNATNSYTGGTLLNNSGLNYINNGYAFGTGTITINRGSGLFATLLGQGGALITITNAFANSTSGGGINFAADANTPVTCTGNWGLGANNINIRNACASGPVTLSGVISGTASLTLSANNPSTIVLSGANTYSGQTILSAGNAGVIVKASSLNKVSGGSSSSSLGHPTTAANGTIAIGSTTFTASLVYTGAGETSDRVINLAGTTGGATLEADGTGALVLTAANTATGAGSKTLTLQGTSTALNSIGAIVDNSAANKTAVVKAQAGTWKLTGANTYTGGTTVNAGTLEIGGSVAGSVTNAGGVLTLDNASALASSATVVLTSGTTVNLNYSGTNAVNALIIDGVPQMSGVWGPIGSTAPNTSAILHGTGFLNVLGKPVIVQQPVSAYAAIGGYAMFSVGVAGDLNGITYQWKQNGVDVPGGNSDTLYISPVQAESAGVYTCAVTNNFGGTVSAGATLTVPTSTAYTSAIMTDGPFSYWRLDETSGTVANDMLGSAYGTYVGGVTLNQPGFSATDTDPAIGLNAGVAYSGVQVTNVNNFKFNVSTPFTLEGWVYFNQAPSGTQRLLSTMGAWGFGVANDHTLQFTLGGKADLNSPTVSPAMQAGVWYYIAVTFNPAFGAAGQYAFYFNGQPLGTVNGQTYTGGASTLYLGCNPSSFPFSEGIDGRIDEVAAYGYTLSDGQIANHYAARYADAPPVPSLPVVTPATNYVSQATTLQENAAGANLSYQWFKVPSTPVGQNSSVLTLSPLSLSDAGSYYVQISNGSITTNSPTNYVAVVPIPTSSTDANLRSLTNGLVLHLPFDGDYKDISGRGNNGTAQGAPTFVTGQVGGNALHYSTAPGSTNYVTLGARPDLKFGATSNFSVAFWVRQTANSISTNLPFFGDCIGSTDGITNLHTGFCFAPYQADDADGGGWMEGISDGTHGMTSPSQYTTFSDINLINDGNWHHLVHVADRSGSFTTYLDGQPFDVEAISFVTGSLSNANAAVIGQDPTGAYPVTAQADLDDLGVWRRTLTAFEVSGIYLAGSASHVSFAPAAAVAAPVTITGISGTTLNYTGGGGSTFTLYSSTDLVHWTQVGSANTSTPGSFTIPAVGSSPAAFYRVQSQ